MGRTERWFLVAASSVFLLALSAAGGTAASGAPDGASERPLPLSTSPVVFAERFAPGGSRSSSREAGSWRDAIELIVLTGTCAIAVAFYSAVTARRTDVPAPARVRRR
jgi:hypothetical protein